MTASLFDEPTGPGAPGSRVVRVIPDQTGFDKTFDYLVPPEWVGRVALGSRVRIDLGGRRVGAWIIALDVEPPTGVALRPIAAVSGLGPDGGILDLAVWARWRWAAKSRVPFLRIAAPPRRVTDLGPPGRRKHPVPPVEGPVADAFATVHTEGSPSVLRLGPTADVVPVVQHAASLGDALVVCPTWRRARPIVDRLRRAGVPVAVVGEEWRSAASGGHVVVGTRNAVWAPVPALAAIVVFDEHDESLQSESSPTWHARDVAIERARRAGVPCVLVSPAPTVHALAVAGQVVGDRAEERAAWPPLVVVDRRDDVGRNALFSPTFAGLVRSEARIVAVLNRKGRAALLTCRNCRTIASCEVCQAAVRRPGDDGLVCARCGSTRPVVCTACGSTDLVTARMGVRRVAEDLAALAGEPVLEVVGEHDTDDDAVASHRLIVGTEAVLHRAKGADVVAFLDFDQELLAPRYRAAEQALALLVRAARVVSRPGERAGRVLVQTSEPDHEVLRAALRGDPTVVSDAERTRREALGFPPCIGMAEVGDRSAAAFVDAIPEDAGLSVRGPRAGVWQVRAADSSALADGLARVPRPPGRLRLWVDPPRA